MKCLVSVLRSDSISPTISSAVSFRSSNFFLPADRVYQQGAAQNRTAKTPHISSKKKPSQRLGFFKLYSPSASYIGSACDIALQ
jgi:hypothetical protein